MLLRQREVNAITRSLLTSHAEEYKSDSEMAWRVTLVVVIPCFLSSSRHSFLISFLVSVVDPLFDSLCPLTLMPLCTESLVTMMLLKCMLDLKSDQNGGHTGLSNMCLRILYSVLCVFVRIWWKGDWRQNLGWMFFAASVGSRHLYKRYHLPSSKRESPEE